MTILDRFDSKANSLNALRLVLATLVIVSHSWAVGGFGDEPSAGGARLGTWAVVGFFGLSGFLITRSRLSGQPARNYYLSRAFRILPGFYVCIVLVALVFAPLSTLLDDGRWNIVGAGKFLIGNLSLYPPHFTQYGVAETIRDVPMAGIWNGSLWTLFWEAVCYVLIGVAVTVFRGHVGRSVVAAFVVATAIVLANETGLIGLPTMAENAAPLFVAFFAGGILWIWADRIPQTAITVAASVVAVAIAVTLDLAQSLAALPFTFLLLWLGNVLPSHGIGRRYDASYGMYIYAWPVQQIVVLSFPDVPVAVFILLSIAGTIPLAYLSCVLVEQRADRLKRRFLAPRRVLA